MQRANLMQRFDFIIFIRFLILSILFSLSISITNMISVNRAMSYQLNKEINAI